MHTACEQICYSTLHQSCNRKTAALFLARSWWVIDPAFSLLLKIPQSGHFVLFLSSAFRWHLFLNFFSTILVFDFLANIHFFYFNVAVGDRPAGCERLSVCITIIYVCGGTRTRQLASYYIHPAPPHRLSALRGAAICSP